MTKTDDEFKFKPKVIRETLEKCDKLIDLYRRQTESMHELKRALVHECAKHLDEPEARAVYIEVKTAELAALDIKLDDRGRPFSIKTGRRLYGFGHGDYFNINPQAERIAKDIQKARDHVTSPAPETDNAH